MERRTLFDAFERVYESHLSTDRSRGESFELATAEYRKNFGFDPYKDFDSFKSVRSRKHKRK